MEIDQLDEALLEDSRQTSEKNSKKSVDPMTIEKNKSTCEFLNFSQSFFVLED